MKMKAHIYIDSSNNCQSCKAEAAAGAKALAAFGWEASGVTDRVDKPGEWMEAALKTLAASGAQERIAGEIVPPRPLEFRSASPFVITDKGKTTSLRVFLATLREMALLGLSTAEGPPPAEAPQ
jgi:hypothetical protein